MSDQVTALRELAMRHNGRKNSLRVIAVTSGKGGVGKTNFTVNLALALVRVGYRVAILDGDLGLANVNIACGIIPPYTLTDVLTGKKSIAEIMIEGPGGVNVLAGSSGLQELADLEETELQKVINNFEQLEQMVDILIVDTGAGSGKTVVKFLEAADDVILLTTSEPTSLTDAYGLLKILNWDDAIPVNVVVNRVRSEAEAQATFQRLAIAVEKFLHSSLNLLGWIYEDPNVGRAVMEQLPLGITYPKSNAYRCISWIAESVAGYSPSLSSNRRKGIKKFLNALLRA